MKTFRQASQSSRSPGGPIPRLPDNTSSTGQHLVYRTKIVCWIISRLPDRILFTGQQLSAGQHLVYRTASRLPHNISFAGQHLVCWKIFHYFFCFWLLTSKSAKNFIRYVQKECFKTLVNFLLYKCCIFDALVSGFKIYRGKQDFAPRKVLNRYDDFHGIILRDLSMVDI